MMRFSVIALAVLASPAVAQPVGEIESPVWRQRPSAGEMMNLYPYSAMANEKIGVSVVQCVAKANGELTKCTAICETPTGWGFAKAGRLAASRHKLQPRLADGRSVEGGTVTISFNFNPDFLPPLPRCDRPG